MKGKKKNIVFVKNYIKEQAINNGGEVDVNMVIKKASNRINEIDKILTSIIKLKEERSNLLDVLFVLKND